MTRVGLLLATPVIELLPRICRVQDGKESGSFGRNTAHLYSNATSTLRLDELYLRLQSNSQVDRDMFEWDTNYFMVVDEKDVNFLVEEGAEDAQGASEDHEEDDFIFVEIGETSSGGRPIPGSGQSITSSPGSTSNAIDSNHPVSTTSTPSIRSNPSFTNSNQIPKLPLIQREKAPLYQFHRIRLFAELLQQYPASRNEIIYHAKVDIPPVLRDQIWAAILGVNSDYQEVYTRIDKVTDFGTDRQIEVDVPRCHQYNPLLASSTGHAKLRRLLKAWVADNKELNFFLMDNAPVLQEYLTIFRHILSFHDPELSTHLDLIGFMPDLYAIPWFLTLFTHVFPLDKIYHLWDKLLVGPSSIPLFAGVAILRQIRDVLLSSEFNDCITLFSESFPEVDIEKCIQSAMTMCKVTPSSVLRRDNRPDQEEAQRILWDLPSVEVRKSEIAPRLSLQDYVKTMPFGLGLDQLATFAPILKKLNKKYHTVITNNDSLGSEVRNSKYHENEAHGSECFINRWLLNW
ncbi:rab-GTPase-TBC domain-containing protein [Umbelopsis sp. PMI_123]|nr:rab-GTPase-TBC domain-containing protein [Umbelopsis sp. PMI_123]